MNALKWSQAGDGFHRTLEKVSFVVHATDPLECFKDMLLFEFLKTGCSVESGTMKGKGSCPDDRRCWLGLSRMVAMEVKWMDFPGFGHRQDLLMAQPEKEGAEIPIRLTVTTVIPGGVTTACEW